MKRTYTTAQAARKTGVSRQTLHFWLSQGFVDAPERVTIGAKSFHLWTEQDIQRLRKFRGTLRRGPKARKP